MAVASYIQTYFDSPCIFGGAGAHLAFTTGLHRGAAAAGFAFLCGGGMGLAGGGGDGIVGPCRGIGASVAAVGGAVFVFSVTGKGWVHGIESVSIGRG